MHQRKAPPQTRPVRDSIHAVIKRKIRDQALDQAAVADGLGLDASTLSRILAGKQRFYTDVLERLADILKTTPSRLYLDAEGAHSSLREIIETVLNLSVRMDWNPSDLASIIEDLFDLYGDREVDTAVVRKMMQRQIKGAR